jgi:hypothetical protein
MLDGNTSSVEPYQLVLLLLLHLGHPEVLLVRWGQLVQTAHLGPDFQVGQLVQSVQVALKDLMVPLALMDQFYQKDLYCLWLQGDQLGQSGMFQEVQDCQMDQ